MILIIKKGWFIVQSVRWGLLFLTSTVPFLGSLIETGTIIPHHLWLIFIGINAHVFGFALNDFIDYHIDKNVIYRKSDPLIQGKISRQELLLVALSQIPIAYLLYIGLLKGNKFGVGILTISIALSVIYNLFSKSGVFPRWLAEFSLGVSVGLLFLSGSFLETGQPSTKSLVFSVSLAIVLISLNSISSGLKDIKTDAQSGAKSFILSMGCKWVSDDRVYISKGFWFYCIFIQSINLILSLILFYLIRPSIPCLILVICLNIYAFLHMRMLLVSGSFIAIQNSLPMLNGFFNYMSLMSFAIPLIPWYMQWVYWIALIRFLLIPIGIAFRMYRTRYHLLK